MDYYQTPPSSPFGKGIRNPLSVIDNNSIQKVTCEKNNRSTTPVIDSDEDSLETSWSKRVAFITKEEHCSYERDARSIVNDVIDQLPMDNNTIDSVDQAIILSNNSFESTDNPSNSRFASALSSPFKEDENSNDKSDYNETCQQTPERFIDNDDDDNECSRTVKKCTNAETDLKINPVPYSSTINEMLNEFESLELTKQPLENLLKNTENDDSSSKAISQSINVINNNSKNSSQLCSSGIQKESENDKNDNFSETTSEPNTQCKTDETNTKITDSDKNHIAHSKNQSPLIKLDIFVDSTKEETYENVDDSGGKKFFQETNKEVTDHMVTETCVSTKDVIDKNTEMNVTSEDFLSNTICESSIHNQTDDFQNEEEFVPGEIWQEDAFELLEKAGKRLDTNSNDNFSKETLFLRFDPLLQNVASPLLKERAKKTAEALRKQVNDNFENINTIPSNPSIDSNKDFLIDIGSPFCKKSVAKISDKDSLNVDSTSTNIINNSANKNFDFLCNSYTLPSDASLSSDSFKLLIDNSPNLEKSEKKSPEVVDIKKIREEIEFELRGEMLSQSKKYEEEIETLKERELRWQNVCEFQYTFTEKLIDAMEKKNEKVVQSSEDVERFERALSETTSLYSELKSKYQEIHNKNLSVVHNCKELQEMLRHQIDNYDKLANEVSTNNLNHEKLIDSLKNDKEHEVDLLKTQIHILEMKESRMKSSLEQKSNDLEEMAKICDELMKTKFRKS